MAVSAVLTEFVSVGQVILDGTVKMEMVTNELSSVIEIPLHITMVC